MIQDAATELMPQHRRFVVTQVVLVLLVTLLNPGTGRSAGAEPLPPTLLPPVSAKASIGDVTYSGCGGQTAPVVNAAYEQELVERVNSVRASFSLPPLKRADPLDDAARYHATDVGQDNYFAHDSYDRSGGALVLACGWAARITTYYPAWRANVSATGLHRGRTTQAVNTQPQNDYEPAAQIVDLPGPKLRKPLGSLLLNGRECTARTGQATDEWRAHLSPRIAWVASRLPMVQG